MNLLRDYFYRKLCKYDKLAETYILQEGKKFCDQYTNLWNDSSIWVKGKKYLYLYESIPMCCICSICGESVIFEECTLHHSH